MDVDDPSQDEPVGVSHSSCFSQRRCYFPSVKLPVIRKNLVSGHNECEISELFVSTGMYTDYHKSEMNAPFPA